jgi:hypothetical protein
MSTFVESVSVAIQPWSDLYASSTVVSTVVQFVHLAGLLVAGGMAIAFDRAALRAGSRTTADRTRFVSELSDVHPLVLMALGLVIASGFALMFADFDVMIGSGVFWVKMAVFGALLVNGFLMRRAGNALQRDMKNALRWRALERAAMRSVGLWILVVFLGVVLTSAA